MKAWILLMIAVICFGLAGVVWGVEVRPHGGTVWTCPTCGAQWYHAGGRTFQPVVPPPGDRDMTGPGQ